MPETAPLVLSEATVGYELDSITLRNIASIRYVRHHEWLDHLLGDPLPTSSILPPSITEPLNAADIESRTAQLQSEIAELESEKQEGWKFYVDEAKSKGLSKAIRTLREDFGTGSVEQTQLEVENLLGVKVSLADVMRSVPVTYDRQAVDKEQAQIASQSRQTEDKKPEKETVDNTNKTTELERPDPTETSKPEIVKSADQEPVMPASIAAESATPGSTQHHESMDVDIP